MYERVAGAQQRPDELDRVIICDWVVVLEICLLEARDEGEP